MREDKKNQVKSYPVSLRLRLHILPETLARSPGHISERFATPIAALDALERQLQPLPSALVEHWLNRPEGHVVLNARRHGFEPGPSSNHPRSLVDVAWTRLALSPAPRNFLIPTAHLIARVIGWNRADGREPILKNWDAFVAGVKSAFGAGYGLSPNARNDVNVYLAEGIAAYLVDRRALNLTDPALEKLLRAHVFDKRVYFAP